jgi:hypothetical protein
VSPVKYELDFISQKMTFFIVIVKSYITLPLLFIKIAVIEWSKALLGKLIVVQLIKMCSGFCETRN